MGRFYFLLALVAVVGCLGPEPQIILQTRLVEKEVRQTVVVEVTRMVREFVTTTPFRAKTPSATATSPPLRVRVSLPPNSNGSGDDAVSLERIEGMLERRTGYELHITVPSSYTDAVEALCTKETDMAWLGTVAYMVANETCDCEARFSIVREGSAVHVSQIMVQSDQVREDRGLEPIRSLQDLDGKEFGFSDPLSTTGYILAKMMLLDGGVEPGHEVFLGGDAQAVLAVYRGEIDAAAGYWNHLCSDGSVCDARATVLDMHPDVAQVVKILCLSDPVPSDAIVFRRDLSPSMKDRLALAFIDLTKSATGSALLRESYGASGLVPVVDGDYGLLRRAAATLRVDFVDILEGNFQQIRASAEGSEPSDRDRSMESPSTSPQHEINAQ